MNLETEIAEKKQIKRKGLFYLNEFSNNKNKLPRKTASNN